jgi:hypothetical protein
MQTLLYHATALGGGSSGIAFHIGATLCFTPFDDEHVYIVQPTQILMTQPIPDGQASFLAETIVEPRLARQGGVL